MEEIQLGLNMWKLQLKKIIPNCNENNKVNNFKVPFHYKKNTNL